MESFLQIHHTLISQITNPLFERSLVNKIIYHCCNDSSLNQTEINLILDTSLSPNLKPLEDIFRVLNLRDACNYLFEKSAQKNIINASDINQLNKILNIPYTEALENVCCSLQKELCYTTQHILDAYHFAFQMHYELLCVNCDGTLSKLIMNYIQYYYNVFPTVIFREDNDNYKTAVKKSIETSDNSTLNTFIFYQTEKFLLQEIENDIQINKRLSQKSKKQNINNI